MPYTDHPTAPSIRSQILANIKSTIVAMDVPLYSAKFKSVLEFNASVLLEGAKISSPACVITPLEDRPDETVVLGKVDHDLVVEILIGVVGLDWREQLERLVAGVSHALRSTYQRGGVAIWTDEVERFVFDTAADKTTGQARLLYQVRYRTSRSDPTTN